MPGKRIVVPSRFLYRQPQVYTTVTRYCNNPGAKWGYFTVLSSFHGDWKIRAQPIDADGIDMQKPAGTSAAADFSRRWKTDSPSPRRPETVDPKIHTRLPVPGDADAQELGDTSVTATTRRRYHHNPPFPWHPAPGHPRYPHNRRFPAMPTRRNPQMPAQPPQPAADTSTTRRPCDPRHAATRRYATIGNLLRIPEAPGNPPLRCRTPYA